MPSTPLTSSRAVRLAALMFSSAPRAWSGSRSRRCRATPACTLMSESEWPSTSWSSFATRSRSASRRCDAASPPPRDTPRRAPCASARTQPRPTLAAIATVVNAIFGGDQASPTNQASRTPASQAAPTDASAQPSAPRATASPTAKAMAMYGGPTGGPISRSTSAAAATTATVGPGKRREPRSATGPIAATATCATARGQPTCVAIAMPSAAGTCTSRLRTTGTSSTAADRGRKRSAGPSHAAPDMARS